jgi:hypothetical protein
MRMSNEDARRAMKLRLDMAYAAGGHEALSRMDSMAVYLLYAEKQADLGSIRMWMQAHPKDEYAKLQQEKLTAEVKDIGGWMEDRRPVLAKDRGPER